MMSETENVMQGIRELQMDKQFNGLEDLKSSIRGLISKIGKFVCFTHNDLLLQ